MESKAKYQTRQMKELLSYLKSVQGRQITANDICEYFSNEGITIGTTTVYRNLRRMVKEGLVIKYAITGSSSAYFEYLGERDSTGNPDCVHCKCQKCGKLIQLQCIEVEKLSQHMLEHHDFEMDSLRTVFYGLCRECREASD